VAKVTLAATPSIACAVTGAGQVILGGSGSTGGGCTTVVGLAGLAHALNAMALTTENARRSPDLHTKRHYLERREGVKCGRTGLFRGARPRRQTLDRDDRSGVKRQRAVVPPGPQLRPELLQRLALPRLDPRLLQPGDDR